MTATVEEIARDLLLADITNIAHGRQEERAEKIVAAYRTILAGVEAASSEAHQTRLNR